MDSLVDEIDITDAGKSRGADGYPMSGHAIAVALPQVGASSSSVDPQITVVRQFLDGIGVPVPPTVTFLGHLQALTFECLQGGHGRAVARVVTFPG